MVEALDRILGEAIAIKILRAEYAGERSWAERLAREVKLARQNSGDAGLTGGSSDLTSPTIADVRTVMARRSQLRLLPKEYLLAE